MLTASYLLLGLAIILAWPAPVVLSRSRWTSRSPFTALLLWQAIALAGGLSMIGAFLVWGLEPLGGNLLSALRGFWGVFVGEPGAEQLTVIHVFALSTALLIGGHLVFTLLLTAYKVTRQRARHRRLLALLSGPSPSIPGAVVVEHQAPVAYCLPGFSGSLTVLSRGLLDSLDEEGLHGVIAHERAHLDQRHDLLVLAFESWHQALPWLPTSRLARFAVQELIEMLADDAALERVSREDLLRSLVAVSAGMDTLDQAARPTPPAGNSAAAGASALSSAVPGPSVGIPGGELSSLRLRRLLSPVAELPAPGRVAVMATSVLLIIVPTLALVAPGLLT
ncbi:M56 family metallopeptidase [Arthrobacter sp. JSM 101049]|uniref:M56 family metallopeptidase n=1 Tax=Arthrobacter sp. JSM 101049 TaxID=929097 RepID=UPI003564E797